MKYVKIEKKEEGRFITRYDITYETKLGKEKVYEIISRDKNLTSYEELHDKKADSVILIMEDEKHEKILICREFRMAVGEWVYNFPAGLIDPGESPIEAAGRELVEETGLHIIEVTDVLENSYSAIGFTNELNVCVMGTAGGEFQKSTSDEEEIEAGWYTKEEVRELLRKNRFAARTQAYCYVWSK